MRIYSVLCSTVLLCAAQLTFADEQPKLPDVSITKERFFECPAIIDARQINDSKAIKEAIAKDVFKDIPYTLKAVKKEFTLTPDETLKGKYWTSKGGNVTLEEEGSRVSRLTCSYTDYYQPESHASFTFTFTKTFKVHVAKHLPEYVNQNTFGSTVCISDDKGSCELPCTSTADYETAQAPHCKFTPAFVVVSNHIDGPRKHPENFGVVFVYPYLEGSQRIQVSPGKDVIFPVKRPSDFALKLSTSRTGGPFTLTHLCMSGSWVEDQLYAAYGTSPHITVTGKIDDYGNTSVKDPTKMGYDCSVSCSVQSPDCWGGIWRWFTAKTSETKDLNRDVLMSRLGPMRDASSAKKSIRLLQEDVEKADLFKEHNYDPTDDDKKLAIEELKIMLTARKTFMQRFKAFIESEDEALVGKEMKTAVYARVLGVSSKPTMDEVKTAYRKLSLAQHPDKVKKLNGAKQIPFEDVGEAYRYFKDEL